MPPGLVSINWGHITTKRTEERSASQGSDDKAVAKVRATDAAACRSQEEPCGYLTRLPDNRILSFYPYSTSRSDVPQNWMSPELDQPRVSTSGVALTKVRYSGRGTGHTPTLLL
jgi:hypothetical protein